jgi:hypothetical protein
MQDGCKVYLDSNVASNGSCSTVTWTLFRDHLLEVDLTQNHRETMAFRNLTTDNLLYFIGCKDPVWIEIHRNSIGLRARSHMTSHYPWGPVTKNYMILEVSWVDGLWTLSYGLSWFHGHGSWLVCEVALEQYFVSYRLRGWSHQPPSVNISDCNNVKNGGPTSKSEHNPPQFHGWNQTESLVWLGHEDWSHRPVRTPFVDISGCVIVWEVVGQHLFKNISPCNFTAGTEWKI